MWGSGLWSRSKDVREIAIQFRGEVQLLLELGSIDACSSGKLEWRYGLVYLPYGCMYINQEGEQIVDI